MATNSKVDKVEVLILFCGILAMAIILYVISNISLFAKQQPAQQPYLNTSHYLVFTPYVQNTSIWLIINGSVYQYWASLDNYALGATPCVLRMSAVENGNVTYTLNKIEANTTLGSAQIVESSIGNSPSQPEYANPEIFYFGGLSVCSYYEMK
jgi:hypothetical protein